MSTDTQPPTSANAKAPSTTSLYETSTWTPERATTQRTLEALRHVSEIDSQTLKLRFRDLLASPRLAVQEIWQILESLPERNYALAERLAGEGLFKDAIFRLKIVLWLAPEMQLAHYLLGSCYYARDDVPNALQHLKRAYKLNPRHAETHFMLATIDERMLPEAARPQTMPEALARGYFDAVAEGYDESQQEQGYSAHIHADEAVRRHIDKTQINYRMLDLGCGTGLCGGLLDDVVAHITGVDFSRAMLDLATKRKRKDGRTIYDRALLRDLRPYLAGLESPQFDIITMAHVANYVGNLDAIFSGCAAALKEGGVWVLQTEPYSGTHPFGVIAKLGRFGHTEDYIQRCAARAGLKIMSKEDFRVYPDYTMQQYVLRKPVQRPHTPPPLPTQQP